jgi:hypothetical protein
MSTRYSPPIVGDSNIPSDEAFPEADDERRDAHGTSLRGPNGGSES